jgi:hypothetical protein
VVNDEHAHRAAPQQAGQPRDQGAAEGHPESERDRQPQRGPQEEGRVDKPDHRVLEQVRGEAALRASLGVDEQPSEVRVDQPAEPAAPPFAVSDVGAVRIALVVRARMVLAVVGDPRDHRPLDRGRAHHGEDCLDGRAGFEAAVGKQTVEPDRDSEPGDCVDDREHRQVVPVEGLVPRLPRGQPEKHERHDRDQRGDDAVAGLMGDRLHRIGHGCFPRPGKTVLASFHGVRSYLGGFPRRPGYRSTFGTPNGAHPTTAS